MREVEVGLHAPEYLYRQEGIKIECFVIEDTVNDASLVGDDPVYSFYLDTEEQAELMMDHLEIASV